jgi:hypothetical protein
MPMPFDNYSFVRINRENINHLEPIFFNAFGIKFSLSDYIKKLDTFYAPISYVGYICYYKELLPCSYYGLYPIYSRIQGKKVLISQSGDTMTHSNHIGRGLFYESAAITYDFCLNNGIYGVFGFPSKSSYPGFKKKLNWNFSENINNYTFIIPTFPIAYFFRKIKFLNFFYNYWLKFVLLFFEKGDFFNGSILASNQDGIIRDKSLWEYKLLKSENKLIKINKTNIVLKFNGRIGVGDIDFCSESELSSILFKLKILAFFTFSAQISFFVSPNTFLDNFLGKCSVPNKGLPIGFRSFSKEVILDNLKFTYFDFDTF